MARPAVAALAFLLAGCLGPDAPADAMQEGLDLSHFEACPQAYGAPLPCEGNGTSPVHLEVSDAVPPGWQCLTFADKRFEGGGMRYPYPDWYTMYGPALGDGADGLHFEFGILYDAHNDTDTVAGVLRLHSEDRGVLYTFSGPSRGFVRVPAPIEDPNLWYGGVLYPGEPGTVTRQYGDETDKVTPRFLFNATGVDVQRVEPFWSTGPYWAGPESVAFGGVEEQWNLVHNVGVGGRTLHFAALPESPVGWGDQRGLAGFAHWGMSRAAPYNMTLSHGPAQLDSTLQPYMVFDAEYEDVRNPAYLAASAFQCGCQAQPITTVEGLACLLGVPLPTAAMEGRRLDVTLG